jgi:putative peptide zinc metalloprotease protein
MERVSYPAGAAAVREGEPGDCMYVIQEGHAEVRLRGVTGEALVVETLGPGETFGEIALLRQVPRTASVIAVTPLVCFRLEADLFMDLLRAHPDLATWYGALARRVESYNFLKRAMPFSPLEPEAVQALSRRLIEHRVAAGVVVVRQGEPGDAFYLVREGALEVLDEAKDAVIATLGPGDCFGEMALLADEPRSATVRARTACTLLALGRQAFQEVIAAHETLEAGLTALATARFRPKHVAHWSLQEQRRADGETVYVLKDEAHARYFSLSERGRWVWDRIDGTITIRDLLTEYRRRFGEAGAGLVYPLLARLQSNGFVSVPGVQRDVVEAGASGVGISATAHRILTAQYTVKRFDDLLTALYRRVGRYSYTRPAQLLWLLITLVGGAAFLYLWIGERVDLAASGRLGWLVPVLVALGWVIHVPIHEMQHALTAKHYGREVRRAGCGWYWFAPMFWTDTSDIWLENRWRRMAVSFAGPYSNVIMGGVVSLVVLVLPDGLLRTALFDITLVLYVGFLTAFNPLMEYDGYYMLEDYLDTSNLRRKAMGFLALEFLPRLRAGKLTRAEQGYALFGICAIAYIAFMCSQIVLVYRTRAEQSVAMHLPHLLAAALGWIVAALFLVLVGLGTAHDIAAARAARRAGATRTMAAVAALAGETAGADEMDRQNGAGGEALEQRISK